jgi:hypothetical protein
VAVVLLLAALGVGGAAMVSGGGVDTTHQAPETADDATLGIDDTSRAVIALPTTDAMSATDTTTTLPPPSSTTTSGNQIAAGPAAPVAYSLSENEVAREAKSVAVSIAETLTNYDAGVDYAAIASSVAGEGAETLLRAAQPLVYQGWSRGTVIYPQLGGLTGGRASVMVVIAIESGIGDETELQEVRTLDVRVERAGETWVFEELASAGGGRVELPSQLSAGARAVLDHTRIFLPDSARWDIYRGEVSPGLLQVMLDLAERVSFGVVTLTNGHPHNVFGTDRMSAHTVGRAVDVYILGDVQVIDDRGDDSTAREVVTWAYHHPLVNQVGAPWDIDGEDDRRSFSNIVHQDHIHIAVDP